MKKTALWLAFMMSTSAVLAPAARAEEWCDLVPGWTLTTHGGKADNVFIFAQLVGGPSAIWIQISDSTVGKANVAAALGAQLAGRNLSIYLDAPSATCANFASRSPIGAIRHVRVLN